MPRSSLLFQVAVLALASISIAAPSSAPQTTFDTSTSTSTSPLAPLNPANFPGHTLIALNDGTFFPSPAFGVGSAFFGQNVTDVVKLALKTGYRSLDNAAVYGNEEYVGEAIRQSGIPRDQLYITTKYDFLNGETVEVEVQKSLQKLGIDYIDLYLIHFPRVAVDPLTTWRSFESLVTSGTVRSIGVSNYGVEDLNTVLQLAEIKPAVNQIRYHLYNTVEQDPVVELGRKEGIVSAAYSSLTPITKEPGGPVDDVLEEISEKEGITEGQVILDWVKGKGIAVVTTSGKDYRQKEQLDVFSSSFPELTKKEVQTLEKAGLKRQQ
ncbi:Aldo/keto reductase [Meredithblackwellia eburnea MCA 4105]